MKKNVIAAAVAAALIAPVAMADVSINGGLQAEIVNLSGDSSVEGLYMSDANEYDAEDTGNYGFLKFSASEDLGDGMKALAVYNLNTKAASEPGVSARDAYVGLSASWGTVLAGNMNTPYKSSTVGWDPMLATSLQARGSEGMSDLHNGYAQNALAYANTFGSVKVVAAVVLDEGTDNNGTPADLTDDTTNGKHAMSFSVNAPVGPVELAVAYVDASDFSNIANLGAGATATGLQALADAVAVLTGGTAGNLSTLDTMTATKVGVKWVSGDITVAGQYEMLSIAKDGAVTGGTGTVDLDVDPTVAYVTASYKMGNNTVSAAYGQTDMDISGVDASSYMMVALNHAFSKNTNAFVGYRASTFDSDMEADVNVISAGMRVNF